MDAKEEPLKPAEDAIEKGKSRFRPIMSLFLLDVLGDRDSRPTIVWAAVTLLGGMLFYHFVEGWSLIDAAYFCVVSLATVGYGDLTPTTPISRIFTMVYLVNGIGILLAFFDRIRVVRTQRLETLAARRKRS
jgi:hypothetical protein